MSKTQPLFILLIVLVSGCTAGEEIEIPEEIASIDNLSVFELPDNPPHQVTFEPEAYFGDTDDVLIGNINSAVANDEGRVYLADPDQKTIHVFQPDGTFIKSIGKEGKGPGEFGNISSLQADEKNLYAYDFSQRRINVFVLENLTFSHTISLMLEDGDIEELSGTYPSSYYVLPDNIVLVSFAQPFGTDASQDERMALYYKVNHESRIMSDKIFSTRLAEFLMDRSNGGVMIWFSPYGGRPIVETSLSGNIFSAWSKEFLIHIYSQSGEQLGAWYYPFQKAALSRDEAINYHDDENYKRMARNDDIPETWPALNSMFTDDQERLWISTIVEDREVYQWWVMSEDGEPLATFTWPRSRSIADIKNGYVYARETDEMGLAQVVRYRVEGL